MSLVDKYADQLLADIRAGRPSDDAVADAMRNLALAHAEHLQELGPIRVMALDPCPRCRGTVIASDTEAKCAAGCSWSYRQHGGNSCSTS